MAKKPLLDATSRPSTAYSEFTKNYRSSENVVDQRDGNGDLRAVMDKDFVENLTTQTRKVSPDEAIRKTHLERR